MPSSLKARVRARMEKTKETYQQALRHVRAEEGRMPVTSPRVERARRVADTAFAIAVIRAREAELPERERLFHDPFASLFPPDSTEASEGAARFFALPFFRDGIRLRTRAIDDAVREAIDAGIRQLVLLGAGFDMRGHRLPEVAAHGVRVYEVDTPEQLERKQITLKRSGLSNAANVAYVGFDFDTRDLAEELAGALEMAGLRVGERCIFVWEGVIGYVDDATIDGSLRAMAQVGGPGARVAFTHAEGSFGSETGSARLARLGYHLDHDDTGESLWRRYLPGEPHPNAWAMRLGVATAR